VGLRAPDGPAGLMRGRYTAEVLSMSERDEGGRATSPLLTTNAPSLAPDGAMYGVRVFGCPVYFGIDILICALVLAFALVPASGAGGMDPDGLAVWAALWAGGTLVGITFHELAHAFWVVVFRLGLRHIFVGVQGGHTALLRPDPPWFQNFIVSVSGPLANLAICGACWWWEPLAPDAGWQANTIHLLFWPNLSLGVFNLLPYFNMDGGHALRALLLPFSKDRRKAAANARLVGAVLFASAFGVFGVLHLIHGGWTGFIFIGIGLWRAVTVWQSSGGSEEFATLSMYPVSEAMGPGIRVRPEHSARALLEAHIKKRHGEPPTDFVQRPYVVMDDRGKVHGVLTEAMISEIAGEAWDWAHLTVAQVMTPVDKVPVVTPETSTTTALVLAAQSECDCVLVIEDGELVGCVTYAHLDELVRSHAA